MGGGGDLRAALAELLEDRDRQSRALDGVGACAQLVDDGEGGAIAQLQDTDDVRDVRGEGRKALLDALLVSDIHQHTAEHGQAGVISCGHHHAAHRHQGQKPERFQADGLAACVGACDNKGIEIIAETDIRRHDPVLRDQGVAGGFQLNDTAVVHHGSDGFHFICQMRLSKDQIQLDQGLVAVDDIGRAARAQSAELK